jgi:hypothetical protein
VVGVAIGAAAPARRIRDAADIAADRHHAFRGDSRSSIRTVR